MSVFYMKGQPYSINICPRKGLQLLVPKMVNQNCFPVMTWQPDESGLWIESKQHTANPDMIFLKNADFFGQDQVQAQPGCQAQPSLQQVQVVCLYSAFWHENHLTW